MIDLLIVKAAIGTVKPHHQSRLAQVTFARFSMSNSKPTTTFICSPLTGAQMEVTYWVEPDCSRPMSFVQLAIPVASAIIGQNYTHAGVESIQYEVGCAAQMAKIILATLGFDHSEIQHFIHNATTELLELTWHTPTTSTKARGSLQKRTATWFEQQKQASAHHDIAIADVDCRRKNGCPGLLVSFKNGDEYRQYGKFDQTASLSKRGKKRYAVSAEMMSRRTDLLKVIETHVRNEVRIEANTLKSLGLLHPSSWTPESVRTALDATWQKTGLLSQTRTGEDAPNDRALSFEAMATLARYRKGDRTLKDTLPPHTHTRHRQAILCHDGTDIAVKNSRNKVRPDQLRQLHYDRRWEPKGSQRELVLCEETGTNIQVELQRGLAFIQDGEVPNIVDQEELQRWLARWKKFAEQEHLINAAPSTNSEAES